MPRHYVSNTCTPCLYTALVMAVEGTYAQKSLSPS